MHRKQKNTTKKFAIIFFAQLLRFFLTFGSTCATICSVANRIIICRNISALPNIAKRMRETRFTSHPQNWIFVQVTYYRNISSRIPTLAAYKRAWRVFAWYAKRIRETSFTSHFDESLRIIVWRAHYYTQEYRSGHNEAVLKNYSFCHSSPWKPLKYKDFWRFLFFRERWVLA